MSQKHITRPGTASPRGLRAAVLCGIAGPVAFTAGWMVSSLRQTGHSVSEVQLSGLAAIDAHDPQIMIAGFVGLGVGSIVFAAALGRLLEAGEAAEGCVDRRDLAASTGPWLVMVAGAAAVAAGLLRRDHMLLVGPGFAGESWHNQAHDIVSGVAYTAMIAAPLMLARRLRANPDLAVLRRPVLALSLVSGMVLALFASRALEPWNGIVQRIAVTLPLAAEALIAARMLAGSRAANPLEGRDQR